MKRSHDTLIILGSHPDTRLLFDWKRAKDVDIFVFNEAVSRGEWIQHASAVFQMHIPAIWRNPANRNDNHHAEWLVGGETPPIIMQDAYPDVPMAESYPVDDVIAKLLPDFHFPPSPVWRNRGGFFGSSVDYAIAYGIYLEYSRIEFYGCEMGLNTEYVYQRPSFCFWVGVAVGRGIEVDYHGSIFDCPLYGYEGDLYLPRKLFDDRIAESSDLAKEALKAYDVAKRAAEEMILKLVRKQAEAANCYPLLAAQVEAAKAFSAYEGARQENERYVKKIEAMQTASDDFRISRTEFEQSMAALLKKYNDAYSASLQQAPVIERLFQKLVKARGFKQRARYADQFLAAHQQQVQNASQMTIYEAAAHEDKRYMTLLDQKYRAAGGQKSVEVLENVNAEQLRNA